MALHVRVLETYLCPVCVSFEIPVVVELLERDEASLRVVVDKLLCIHHLRYACKTLACVLVVVCDLTVALTFSCGDENDTIAGLGTIDCSRCSVLEDFH